MILELPGDALLCCLDKTVVVGEASDDCWCFQAYSVVRSVAKEVRYPRRSTFANVYLA